MSNTHKRFRQPTFALLLGALGALTASAHDALTAERFVQIDHEVRQVTLAGMAQRLALLQADAGLGEQLDDSAANAADVASVYAAYGVSATQHAAYGSRHADEVQAFLDANAHWADDDVRLREEFDTLSAQIAALATGGAE